ncbi:ATP-binding protein [Acinetobacter baumannii]|uniref:sensor histidine kinase n=1 Tax=Acinetobacter baumannii TaxID=470 RepID=UPI000A349962|nr:sensor histidine kinase [Acinetobacter baumannii]EHU2158609.1 sensor histidine kinase [Acinetobacter baumannii]MBJ9470979.1 sensor histidine kinase [Acinetobacter baumannii]MCG5905897.1 ATP-binding protein [Acinetobacter baumannii]MDC4510742.1 ATP-binding protein [Acinetobacter baumannii]MDG9776131.1 ATP-binding protein [Acinetobacter baumannii]
MNSQKLNYVQLINPSIRIFSYNSFPLNKRINLLHKLNPIRRIRPSGRHLATIGKELIQNEAAAIIELVKNAYDADADEIKIQLFLDDINKTVEILIVDNGHGMDLDTFLHKWMVPSTNDKFIRKQSPTKSRMMQGRKGIGRYAVALLGNKLSITSITKDLNQVHANIDWDEFNKVRYLDEIKIEIDDRIIENGEAGTTLLIKGNEDYFEVWNRQNIDTVIFELKKLISPLDSKRSDFRIFFQLAPEENSYTEIKPFPIVDFFDYRIRGEISEDGKGELIYSCQKEKNLPDVKINFDYYKPTQCGSLKFDYRVFDLETDALKDLLMRTQQSGENSELSRQDIKSLLKKYHGVGVFRNGFRIRPLGDSGYDWMEMNLQRVNNPSLRISENQIIGYVRIQSEEASNLYEKSARDGLRENEAYKNLVNISQQVLRYLEMYRFKFRENTGKSRKNETVEEKLSNILSSEKLSEKINETLNNSNLDVELKNKISNQIIGLVKEDNEKKNIELEYIKKAIATYQGQATLGKIVNRLIHEGRRPLNYFQNEIPNLKKWKDKYDLSKNELHYSKVSERIDGVLKNSKNFVLLFKKIDPLATARRPNKKKEKLKEMIQEALDLFDSDCLSNNVLINFTCSDTIEINCWEQDIVAIFFNLIENSLYWMISTNSSNKCIDIHVNEMNDVLVDITYKDTGPGIKIEDIESEIIFNPEFSGKPEGGTGLGLAIAGEAAIRNNLKLQSIENSDGALFKLTFQGNQ